MSTTPVSTMQDILDVIRANPEIKDELRRLLLDEELLDLPRRFSEFVQITQENFALVNERLSRLEEGQARLEVRMDRLEEGQARLEVRMDKLEVRMDKLEVRMDKLEEGQARLEVEVRRLGEGQARLEVQVGRIGGSVRRLVGLDYEAHAVRVTPRRVRRGMNVQEGVVIDHSRYPEPFLINLTNEPHVDSLIEEAEAEDLILADVVLSGKIDGEECLILGEISITVQETDVVRARSRAAILQRASGVRTMAVVIGDSIEDDALAACGADVTFLQVNDPEKL